MKKLWDRKSVDWSYSHGQPVWFVNLQSVLVIIAFGFLVGFVLKNFWIPIFKAIFQMLFT